MHSPISSSFWGLRGYYGACNIRVGSLDGGRIVLSDGSPASECGMFTTAFRPQKYIAYLCLGTGPGSGPRQIVGSAGCGGVIVEVCGE